MNKTETKKFGEFGALNNSVFFWGKIAKPSLKMSERSEPQNFRKDGSLGFGEMGVPRILYYYGIGESRSTLTRVQRLGDNYVTDQRTLFVHLGHNKFLTNFQLLF